MTKTILVLTIINIFCVYTFAQSLIVSTGSAGTYAVQYPANIITSPPQGMMLTFKANHNSPGSSTL
ncbi:MAG: hypothetical protein NW207_06375, partial [Cytophagales bacterium]|nr:hypothetical protein [Cytophagales bacterium]